MENDMGLYGGSNCLSDEEQKLLGVGKCHPDFSVSQWRGLGNDQLYKCCEQYPFFKESLVPYSNEAVFSSQAWLIGRAYAASPQRFKKNGAPIEDDAERQNGYTTFFDKLAYELFFGDEIKDPFKGLRKSCEDHVDGRYKFTSFEEDKDSLVDSAALVIRFNQVVIKARTSSTDNVISFSSKFLHFQLPQQVFIYDSIAGRHARAGYHKNSMWFENRLGGNPGKGSPSNTFVESFTKRLTDWGCNAPDDKAIGYAVHCLRMYCLAADLHAVIKKNGYLSTPELDYGRYANAPEGCGYCYITRLADIYASNIDPNSKC